MPTTFPYTATDGGILFAGSYNADFTAAASGIDRRMVVLYNDPTIQTTTSTSMSTLKTYNYKANTIGPSGLLIIDFDACTYIRDSVGNTTVSYLATTGRCEIVTSGTAGGENNSIIGSCGYIGDLLGRNYGMSASHYASDVIIITSGTATMSFDKDTDIKVRGIIPDWTVGAGTRYQQNNRFLVKGIYLSGTV